MAAPAMKESNPLARDYQISVRKIHKVQGSSQNIPTADMNQASDDQQGSHSG